MQSSVSTPSSVDEPRVHPPFPEAALSRELMVLCKHSEHETIRQISQPHLVPGLFKALHEASAGEALVIGGTILCPTGAPSPFLPISNSLSCEKAREKRRKDPSGFHLAAFSQTVNQVVRSLEGKIAP